MALYELTDDQVRQLKIIIGAAKITGQDASAIVMLTNALAKPATNEVVAENGTV